MDKTKIAVGVFDKHASVYQEKFMDVSQYGDSFDFFCSGITRPNANILELACGPGNITNYLLKKRPDFRILATDLSPRMVELAKFNNPAAEFKLMDCRDLKHLYKNLPQDTFISYDGVMCGFCLPYLDEKECKQLIRNVSDLLKPGGLFYLSTMEDEYNKSGLKKGSGGEEIFMHYYLAGDLVTILESNRFKITNLTRKIFDAADGTQVTDLLIIAEKIHE